MSDNDDVDGDNMMNKKKLFFL